MLSVRILVAAVTVVMGVQAAPVGNTLQALAYLTQFGYIEGSTNEKGNLITEDSVNAAVADFQKFAGLKQTGKLDNETVHMMSLPRCGVKDKVGHSADARKKRYALQGSRWRVRELTYKISKYPTARLDKASVDTEVKKSFEVWSKHTNLKFVAKTSGRVHIEIRFEKGEHGDGDPFDGPGGTLAHAYFPIYGGDAHFDDTERWTINSYSGTNLFQVAAHEFGHSLGLSHSDVQSALMAPFYRGYAANFKLDTDDIRGIQALYGQKKDSDEPTKRPDQPVTKPSKPRPTEGDHEEGELCSDSTIDAIFKTANQKTYAFKGEFYWEVTDDGLADGYPRSISKDFKNLPTNIDAAFTWFNGKTYFFKDDKYWRFTEKALDEGYPKQIKQGFVGIPEKVDAAFVWSGNGKIYFFKGSKYWKFDPERSPSVSKDYPKEITNWNGIPKNIDAAFQWTNGYTYFFKGTNYWRFNDRNFAVDAANPPFPRSSAVWWFDCKSMSADGLQSGSLQTELQDDIYNDGMDVDNDEGDVNEHQPDNFSSAVTASNSRKFTVSSLLSIVLLLGTLLLV